MSFIKGIFKRNWTDVKIPQSLDEFIGRSVKVTGDDHKERVVEIEKIMGNLRHPHRFEIVAKGEHYLISMLEFYGQMNGETITKEEIEAFEQMDYLVKPTPQKMRELWIRKQFLQKFGKKLN